MSTDSFSKKNIRNKAIGVVGGGQLAQMLVQAAISRNVDVFVQTSSFEDPASGLASRLVLANSIDCEGTKKLANGCLGITFENEWINIEELKELESEGVAFYPSIKALNLLIDKISQRRLLNELRINCPDWSSLKAISTKSPMLPEGWSYPVMAKAARGGYDGKGTKVLNDNEDLNQLLKSVDHDRWYLEAWVQYEKEIAVVASRDSFGIIRYLPIAETNQHNQICNWVIAPANISHQVEAMIYNVSASILTKLDYVGVIALEFFYGADGLLVNEIAPRTHNSGHFSIEACASSQFDQQVCITAGINAPSTELIQPGALMVNLLGLSDRHKHIPLETRLNRLRSHEKFNLHWYGKELETPGRKLGHITVLLQSEKPSDRQEEAFLAIQSIRAIWPI